MIIAHNRVLPTLPPVKIRPNRSQVRTPARPTARCRPPGRASLSNVAAPGVCRDFVLETPTADFYITRIYAPQAKRYAYIVFLTPLAWHRLPVSYSYVSMITVEHIDKAVAYFPQPVQVRIETVAWVMIEYKQWIEWVRQAQRELENDT